MVGAKLQVCGHFGCPYQLTTSSMNHRLKSVVNEVDMTCFNYPSVNVKKVMLEPAISPFQIQSLLDFSHCSPTRVIVFCFF